MSDARAEMRAKGSALRAARSVVAGAAITPIAAGMVLSASVAPASASSDGISIEPDRKVIKKASSVRIEADPELLDSGTLRLRGPAEKSFHTVDEEGLGGGLEYTLDISCPDYSGECHGRPARNGTYTVQLSSEGLLSHSKDLERFKLRISPKAPEDVSVSAAGSKRVVVRWDGGDVPDMAAYDIFDASGARVRRVSASGACHDGECSTTVRAPQGAAGTQVAYSVKARRHVAPGSDRTIASASSQRVSVVLPAATRVSPRATSPMPSPTVENEGFDRPSAKLPRGLVSPTDLRDLRPLASASALKLPDIARRSDRTYRRELQYPLPVLPTPSPRDAAGDRPSTYDSGPGTGARTMTAVQARPLQWWKTVALGLVLLVVAAHLGAWTWRTRPAPQVSVGGLRPRRGQAEAGRAVSNQQAGAADADADAGLHASSTQAGRSYRGRRRAH